jgi:hypothetical protein
MLLEPAMPFLAFPVGIVHKYGNVYVHLPPPRAAIWVWRAGSGFYPKKKKAGKPRGPGPEKLKRRFIGAACSHRLELPRAFFDCRTPTSFLIELLIRRFENRRTCGLSIPASLFTRAVE